MSQENVRITRSLYEAFDRGDLDMLEKNVTNNAVWNEAENSLYWQGSPYRSFSQIRDKVLTPNARDFDNFHVEIDRVLDAGDDHVVCAGRYRGKYKKTGKELSSQFCHLLHYKQGKVDFFQEFVDTYEQARVAGLIQPLEKMTIREPVLA